MNLKIYEETIKIILDSKNEDEKTKSEKIKNLKSHKVLEIVEKTIKIYKESNAILRWNLIKKETESMLEKQNSEETKEEKNNVVNKLMTIIQIYVDKEKHIEKKIKKTKLFF